MEFRNNTVQILGLVAKCSDFYVEAKVYANQRGKLSTTKFDGYTGHIGFSIPSVGRDRVEIEDILSKGNRYVKFNNLLFTNAKKESKPLSTFQKQRTVPVMKHDNNEEDNDDDDWNDEFDNSLRAEHEIPGLHW